MHFSEIIKLQFGKKNLFHTSFCILALFRIIQTAEGRIKKELLSNSDLNNN